MTALENAVAPGPTRRIDWRMRREVVWKTLVRIMTLVGVTTTAIMTALCGVWMYGYYLFLTELPVIEGPGLDGASAATAMIVEAPNEGEGVAIEHIWIETRYPMASIVSQSLIFEGDRTYDVFEIDPVLGGPREIWFDITDWYGEW